MIRFLCATILACSVILAQPGDAAAKLSAAEFLKQYDSLTADKKAVHLAFLNGMVSGMQWANIIARRKNPGVKIYCMPKTAVLADGQDVAILRNFVGKHPKYGGAPLGLAMMFALIVKWPCR